MANDTIFVIQSLMKNFWSCVSSLEQVCYEYFNSEIWQVENSILIILIEILKSRCWALALEKQCEAELLHEGFWNNPEKFSGVTREHQKDTSAI